MCIFFRILYNNLYKTRKQSGFVVIWPVAPKKNESRRAVTRLIKEMKYGRRCTADCMKRTSGLFNGLKVAEY